MFVLQVYTMFDDLSRCFDKKSNILTVKSSEKVGNSLYINMLYFFSNLLAKKKEAL